MAVKKIEADRVRAAIRNIYADWHQCALLKREGRVPKGTLCDMCSEMIEATMADLLGTGPW